MSNDVIAPDHDTTDVAPLTDTEVSTLAECEQAIERNRKSFVEAGNALATIRGQRLYRQTHGTFEAYCKERWRIGRNYANKQITAAALVEELGTTVPILPTSESHVRALLQFDEGDRPKVWQTAVEKITTAEGDNPNITANKISKFVEEEISAAKEPVFEKMKAERRKKEDERRAKWKAEWGKESKAAPKRREKETAESSQIRTAAATLPGEYNAVTFIREVLANGQWRSDVTGDLPPEKAVRCHVNEYPSQGERKRRQDRIDSADYVLRSAVEQGKTAVVGALAVMVWMGVVEMREDAYDPSYRMTTKTPTTATACPNCGTTTFDEDGDCIECKDQCRMGPMEKTR